MTSTELEQTYELYKKNYENGKGLGKIVYVVISKNGKHIGICIEPNYQNEKEGNQIICGKFMVYYSYISTECMKTSRFIDEISNFENGCHDNFIKIDITNELWFKIEPYIHYIDYYSVETTKQIISKHRIIVPNKTLTEINEEEDVIVDEI